MKTGHLVLAATLLASGLFAEQAARRTRQPARQPAQAQQQATMQPVARQPFSPPVTTPTTSREAYEQLLNEMREMNQRLESRIAAMNAAATQPAKINAMEEVIMEMADQRRHYLTRLLQMQRHQIMDTARLQAWQQAAMHHQPGTQPGMQSGAHQQPGVASPGATHQQHQQQQTLAEPQP